MKSPLKLAKSKIEQLENILRIRRLARRALLASQKKRSWRSASPEPPSEPANSPRPVAFFNASTRIGGFSQNAAFSFLAASSLQLAGVPIAHFACKSGMSRCVLGTQKDQPDRPMPCQECTRMSSRLFANGLAIPFTFHPDADLAIALKDMSIAEMSALEYTPSQPLIPGASAALPLGALALPSLRWVLRRYHIPDEPAHRSLMRQFILSAYSIIGEFNRFIDQVDPQAVVVFNGTMFPEASVCWTARQRGVRVITHEVGYQRFSAFFTDGDATAYPVHIPQDFKLTVEQNARLDAYLEQRFQGQFTMAGIRFWPEMRGLDPAFLEKAAQFRQLVPIFTNVIYDTSQIHANVVFEHMFAWLDSLLEVFHNHPETLFVIRAHPDEMRPNSRKQSRETVRDWVANHSVQKLDNVIFIDSQEFISSYELIQRARFVMVYNSSIGLEAALMGATVLCAGKARYTQYPVAFLPPDQPAYHQMVEEFLSPVAADSKNTGSLPPLAPPAEFQGNARKFLYYTLYITSLPFDDFLETWGRAGFVRLKPFAWHRLLPANSPTLGVVTTGILNGTPFLVTEQDPSGTP